VSALYGIMYSGSEGNWCDVVVQCLYLTGTFASGVSVSRQAHWAGG